MTSMVVVGQAVAKRGWRRGRAQIRRVERLLTRTRRGLRLHQPRAEEGSSSEWPFAL